MAFIVDGIRTPIGSHGGALASVRPDDLAALVISRLIERQGSLDAQRIDDVILGCANQAGEDNRNVARMALLLAGLPQTVPGETVNRLCASGLCAVVNAARAIDAGQLDVVVAGGVESMTRAPFVLSKAESAFSRSAEIFDTSIGWRFVNSKMKERYGIDSMGQTAENVAQQLRISRADQDAFALRSQQKATKARAAGRFNKEIVAVEIPQRKGPPTVVNQDEFIRPDTSLESLTKLRPAFTSDASGSVTAGNSSGINDGAAALLIASERAVKEHGFQPLARVVGAVACGVEPRTMGLGPVPAVQQLMQRTKLSLDKIDVIELNEAFAAQSLGCLRQLGLQDDDPRVNINGGAIALGHPLGMSGARLVTTATLELLERKGRYAICTMCVGVGQGVAALLERM